MQTQKKLNGTIVLGLVVLLMVTATQFTAADSGSSAVVTMDDGSVHEAMCFDGGVCIIPGEPESLDDVGVEFNNYLTWFWRDWNAGQQWSDVVKIEVIGDDSYCQSPDPESGLCHIWVWSEVQGDGFGAECAWRSGYWDGHLLVNDIEHQCVEVEFEKDPTIIPGVCTITAGVKGGDLEGWGTGRVAC
jgi:hypothetical protein